MSTAELWRDVVADPKFEPEHQTIPPKTMSPVVRRILEHLGRWQPEAMERSPPVPPEAWLAKEIKRLLQKVDVPKALGGE